MAEANDAARLQTAKRHDARSVAAAGTKLQGDAADKPDGRQSAKTAGLKAERNRGYNNECFLCGNQGHKQWDCPQNEDGERRSWPEPRPGPHAAAAAAAAATIH